MSAFWTLYDSHVSLMKIVLLTFKLHDGNTDGRDHERICNSSFVPFRQLVVSGGYVYIVYLPVDAWMICI